MRNVNYIPLFIFLCYLALYSSVNYPAISQAWRFRDDFAFTETPRPNKGQLDSLKHGRPVHYLLSWAYQLEGGEQWARANILLRLLQVLLHCWAVLVAGALLTDRRRPWIGYSAVLLFLLYPFNGEAVLWRAAIIVPLAAALSLSGVALLCYSQREEQPTAPAMRSSQQAWDRLAKGSGLTLIALAMLTHQQAALAGVVVWVVLIGQQALQLLPMPKQWWRTTLWIMIGYTLGVALSRLFIYRFFGPAGRASLTSDWWEKVHFGLTLNQIYLWSAYYPSWLVALHLLIVAGGIGVACFYFVRQRWAGLLVLLTLLSLFFLPFAIVLVTVESWPAWRITYLAPFLVISAWLYLDYCFVPYRLLRFSNFLLLALLLIGYVPIARRNATEYVTVFHQDLAEARTIAAWAATHTDQPTSIVVATAPDYVRTWNLYEVQYMQAESKVSAFLADWTISPLFTFFTDLTPQQNKQAVKQACIQLCLQQPNKQPFSCHLLQPGNVICTCP